MIVSLRKLFTPQIFATSALVAAGLAAVQMYAFAQSAQPGVFPSDSRIASSPTELQRLLLSPLDEGDVKQMGAFRIAGTQVKALAGQDAKTGRHALEFAGMADGGGAKGDFVVSLNPQGEVQTLGMWVFIRPDSNVSKAGFQITDAEGESLMAVQDADWTGWKWVEADVKDAAFVQAYPQQGKTGKAEFPLKNVNIIWFAKEAGRTSLGVDALAAVSKIEAPAQAHTAEAMLPAWGEAGQPLAGNILIHNYSDKARTLSISVNVQSNPAYLTPEIPDAILGSDIAQAKPSWLEIAGQRVENNSLTDNDADTCLMPDMPKEGLTEIFQTVDLGKSHDITGATLKAGDANWIRKVDIAASADGKTYTPIAGLQGIEMKGKWSPQTLTATQPSAARYVRLRYHNDGDTLPPHFRTLSALRLYDGAADEIVGVPATGKELARETLTVTVPARNFAIAALKPTPALGPDAYYCGMVVEEGGRKKITCADYFVMPGDAVTLSPASRFGMNVSTPGHIPMLARAGYGWVRFENMKWQFYNPGPGVFRFDGTVSPWKVPFDQYYTQYRAAGMSILPFIFESPAWASSAPADTKRRQAYAPRDLKDYTQAIFEAVARYGSAKVEPDKLHTSDKVSGLNMVNTYEIWNEPNLNNPGWGFFVGPLSEYYKVFRAGAEGVKQADPAARVTNGGWAGLSMEWVDTMRTFRYPDGKTPLDFTDVLNVHFYAGKSEPEYSTQDPNAFREGAKPSDIQTLEKDLMDLADWRDELKPGMPIWVTETGHDVGGPIGRTERHQAAKLPRGHMLSFANGVEKVFIYRETGSTPDKHAGAGILRNDGSVRPSYFTMATLIRQLDGVTATRVPRLETADARVWMYYWPRPASAGGDVLTAWIPDNDTTATLGVDLGRCRVTTAFGATSDMDVTKDFPVSCFPVYITRISNTKGLDALRDVAATREAARRRQMAFDATAEAYLFDFGSRESAGTRKVGKTRPFTAVLMEDAFDGTKDGSKGTPYGFVQPVSGKNVSAHWVKSPLEKDAVQLYRPATFKVQVKPGLYRVEFKGENFREASELRVAGTTEGEAVIALPSANKGGTTPTTEPQVIAVKDGLLEFQFPAGNIQWLTLVEVAK
ncbi:hypothetical protein DB346_16285 [Verrucomicrobia bacterium LW23]|nr:hypothetical protein DB346_16285 [Verrucomicrobia bacterium LW23]